MLRVECGGGSSWVESSRVEAVRCLESSLYGGSSWDESSRVEAVRCLESSVAVAQVGLSQVEWSGGSAMPRVESIRWLKLG